MNRFVKRGAQAAVVAAWGVFIYAVLALLGVVCSGCYGAVPWEDADASAPPAECHALSGLHTVEVIPTVDLSNDMCQVRNLIPEQLDVEVEAGPCREVELLWDREGYSMEVTFFAGPEGIEGGTLVVVTGFQTCYYELEGA